MGEQLQYNNAFKVQKDSKYLERLVVFDPAVKMNPEDKTSIYFDDFLRLGDNAHAESTVKIRMTEAVPEDLATIIYTSGTTGESKGVMLPHSCYLEAMRIHDVRLPLVTDKDLSMSFLPMTHIFEKAWCYYCLQIILSPGLDSIQENLLHGRRGGVDLLMHARIHLLPETRYIAHQGRMNLRQCLLDHFRVLVDSDRNPFMETIIAPSLLEDMSHWQETHG